MKKFITISINLLIINTLSFGLSATLTPVSSSISRLLISDAGGSFNYPDPSAALEVRPSATTNAKGLLLPNLTASQITGITSPARGLLVTESQVDGTMEYYTGNRWAKVFVLSSQQSSVLTYSHNVNSSNDGFSVYGSTVTGYSGYFTSTGAGQAIDTSGSIQFQNNGEADGKVLTTDASGVKTWQDLPKIAFMAYYSGAGSYTVPINTAQIATFAATDFNIGSNYSTATNKFTATKSGIYNLSFRLWAMVAS